MIHDLAPVEYVVIGFPGNRFNGDIAPAIADLVDRGLVRILDLVFVKKDDDGTVATFEYDELDEATSFVDIDGEADGLMSDDDVRQLAESIPSGSSALFILWEDRWAAELGRAVRSAGGELIAGGRLPHAMLQAVMSDIDDGPQHEAGS